MRLVAALVYALGAPALCTGALLPVLPISTASSWTSPRPGGAFYGDVRAVITLPPSFSGPTAAAQIFWRRRDPNPAVKEVRCARLNLLRIIIHEMRRSARVQVLVVDGSGKEMSIINTTVESTCGLVYFSASAPGTYYVYYLPFIQNSGGASVTFSWQGCNSTDPTEANPCVLGRRALSSAADSVCTSETPAASVVTRLENRNDFNAFTDMEMIAAPAEVDATVALLQVGRGDRVFALLPRGGC
jgi:hypothetical protein